MLPTAKAGLHRRPVTRGTLAKSFAPLLKKCVGQLQLFTQFKKFRPLSENSSPPWCAKLVTGLLHSI